MGKVIMTELLALARRVSADQIQTWVSVTYWGRHGDWNYLTENLLRRRCRRSSCSEYISALDAVRRSVLAKYAVDQAFAH